MCLLLIFNRSQDKLDFTKIGNSILEDQRIIILEVEFNGGAQRSALGEKNKVLELEDSLYNLIRGIRTLLNLHCAVVFTDNRLLFREITYALENEIGSTRRHLHIQLLTKSIHIATDLLEIKRRHMNNAGEVETGNLDIFYVRVEQLEVIRGHSGLLRVLHADSKFVGIGRREIESQGIAVAHSLDELEKINHIHT